MSGPVIVLGWDGLDLPVAERGGVADAFGAHRETIGTYVNPATDEPHTKELWPSMITGLHPDEHGIHATANGESRPDWDSDALAAAARCADYTLPQQVQTWAGAKLQAWGAKQTAYGPAYYREHRTATVVDDADALPISIPNYQTERDRRLGLDANRDGVWAELSIDRTGAGTDFEPQIDTAKIHDIIGRELGRRVSLTIEGIHSGAGLIWTWFGALDTVGHINPAVDAPLQRQYYEVAAAQTAAIRRLAPDDATVIAVSDHGIQDGGHTQYATIASDDAEPVNEIGHVFEIADWIRSRDVAGGRRSGVDGEVLDKVTGRLEHLGYTT